LHIAFCTICLLWSDKRVHNYSFKWMNKHARTVLQFNMQVVIIT
jgi:hypothetical protein